MQIQPILAALKKHRLATILIALEIALACAVLVNATFLITGRLAMMNTRSGVDENALGLIALKDFAFGSGGITQGQAKDLNARMVAGLRDITGVESVHVVNSVPFGPQRGNAGITLDQAGKQFRGVVEFYTGDPGTPEALGLKLVAGHMPSDGDYQPTGQFMPTSSQVLISRALAEHLWPGQSALGKIFWMGESQFRVIGILAHLVVQQISEDGEQAALWSVFVPALSGDGVMVGNYLIQARPQDLQRVMTEARTAVAKIAPEHVLDRDYSYGLPALRAKFFQTDRAMAGLLIGVIAALLLVTALGIVGLASFWVSQRTKQIGIRRALGATRADILHYFQTENFLIVTFGIVVGVVLAIGINLLLMKFFEVPRLPLWYLPVGVVVLWLLGQLAVLAPALRAAAVQPVVATRSV